MESERQRKANVYAEMKHELDETKAQLKTTQLSLKEEKEKFNRLHQETVGLYDKIEVLDEKLVKAQEENKKLVELLGGDDTARDYLRMCESWETSEKRAEGLAAKLRFAHEWKERNDKRIAKLPRYGSIYHRLVTENEVLEQVLKGGGDR